MPAEPSYPVTERTPLPVVQLRAVPPGLDPAEVATAGVRFAIGGEPVQLEIAVPARPTPFRDLLPVLQGMANVEVDAAVRAVEREGLSISCRAGCAACCRPPVPVAETEARALVRLIERMPPERQAHVRARFDDAVRRLGEAGLLDRLERLDQNAGAEATQLALDYFKLGIACPFLEDECCSIHSDRPLACREFLVVSPPEFCWQPEGTNVRRVPLRGEVFRAVQAMDAQAGSPGFTMLTLAPRWVAAHPEEPAPRPGPAWLQDVFGHMAGRAAAPDAAQVHGWVLADNLRPFLTALAWVVGSELEEADWQAVAARLPESDVAADRWYETELAGRERFRVRVARDPGRPVVQIQVQAPQDAESLVELALAICQQFRLQPA